MLGAFLRSITEVLMIPNINKTRFGSITINKQKFEHDVLITLAGKIKKRKKKLSKKVFGTSHIISRKEAKYIFEPSAEGMIIGSGQNGLVKLSEEAKEYFKKKNCKVMLLRTPKAIKKWNDSEGRLIGLFHVTC
jgi:hypothetical protein